MRIEIAIDTRKIARVEAIKRCDIRLRRCNKGVIICLGMLFSVLTQR